MALTHVSTTLQAACNSVVDLLDVGASAPTIDLAIADNTVSATIVLDATNAFGDATDASPSVATITGTPEDASATGNAAEVTKCIFYNGDTGPDEVMRGTVSITGGGGDMELTSLVIAAGEKVTLTSMTYTVSD